MKRTISIVGVLFVLLLGACAPRAVPTVAPVDIQHTAEAAALSMVAETKAAEPSATSVPPTHTPSLTAPPSSTPLPTSGTAPATSTTFSASFTPPAPQAQPTTRSGEDQDICNQPLTAWQGPTANFTIANQTKPEGTIVLSMYVETELGQCGYLIITGDSFSGPAGQYSAAAFITGPQNLKAFGDFRITAGNWKIVVRNDSIDALGGCFPNC